MLSIVAHSLEPARPQSLPDVGQLHVRTCRWWFKLDLACFHGHLAQLELDLITWVNHMSQGRSRAMTSLLHSGAPFQRVFTFLPTFCLLK